MVWHSQFFIMEIKKNFGKITKISKVNWREIEDFSAKYDWVWACPTETSYGLKIPITDLKKFSKKITNNYFKIS